MPKGSPSPDHIIGRKATFFSIDTNVLKGKGADVIALPVRTK